jgi:hypothetical protein
MDIHEFVAQFDRNQTVQEILDQIDEGTHVTVLCAIYAALQRSGQLEQSNGEPTSEALAPFAKLVESWE